MQRTPRATPLPATGAQAGTEPARRHRRVVAAALLPVLAVGQGCYSYHVTDLQSLTPDEEIRVSLDAAEYRRVAPGGSMAGPQRIEGRFAGLKEDSLIVAVWIGESYVGTPFASAYQDIMIPREEVVGVEHRQLSKGRTALVTAGSLALIAVLIDSVGLVQVFGSGGGDGPPDPPEPEGSVIGY